MSGHAAWSTVRSYSRDRSVVRQRLAPGTRRRVLGYASPYRRLIAVFLGLVVLDAALVVVSPLLLRLLVDDGVIPRDTGLVVTLALWNEELEVRRLQKRIGIDLPIVEIFSNDARLADLAAWDPTADSGAA